MRKADVEAEVEGDYSRPVDAAMTQFAKVLWEAAVDIFPFLEVYRCDGHRIGA